MKKYENQLKSAMNSVLLPMGFMQADDVYYRWDTGTDIVTVVRCRVEDPSEFCIQLGAQSAYQGVKLESLRDIKLFDLDVTGHHYGLACIDTVSRDSETGRRVAYTPGTFEKKVSEGFYVLTWLLENVFLPMDEDSLFDYLSRLSSYRAQYDMKDSEYSIPEPFEENFYLALHAGKLAGAAKLLLFIYNVNRQHGQYGKKNDFESIRNALELELDAVCEEWYMNTFHRPFWNALTAGVLAKKRREWMLTNEERIVSVICEELRAKADVIRAVIDDAAEANIEYLRSLI